MHAALMHVGFRHGEGMEHPGCGPVDKRPPRRDSEILHSAIRSGDCHTLSCALAQPVLSPTLNRLDNAWAEP